jgi:uncharacterized protein
MSTHEFIEVKSSGIHRHGIFAKKDIPKGTRLIEYLGIKVTKEESQMIDEEAHQRHLKDPKNNAGTYLFELNDTWDLDGDIPDNDAKFINHSCEPNCEVDITDSRIWIDTIKDIKKGEEITYNYGFEIDDKKLHLFKEHPCRCGSERCAGYILDEDQWPKMRELLDKEKTKKE